MGTEVALPAKKQELSPAQQYRKVIEASVEREIRIMLEHDPVAFASAKARIAIAFRSASQANPVLLSCTPESVVSAVLMSVVTGLAPGGVNPTCYLTSRYNKKAGGQELQWSASHRGLIQLANRSGYGVKAVSVHNGDDFDLDLSAIKPPVHRPGAVRTWENLTGCYVVIFRLDTGSFVGWEWVDRAQIEARRANSDAWKRGQKQDAAEWERSSPWYKWPVEMALKTAIKWAAARGVLPTDDALGRALAADSDDRAEEEYQQPVAAPKALPVDPLRILDAPEREPEPELVLRPIAFPEGEKAAECARMERELSPAEVEEIRATLHITGDALPSGSVDAYHKALSARMPK